MSQIIKYLSLIATLLLPTFLQAENFGRHITIETIELEPSTTIPTGTTVNLKLSNQRELASDCWRSLNLCAQ
jgi:hypothetical protein